MLRSPHLKSVKLPNVKGVAAFDLAPYESLIPVFERFPELM